MFKVKPCGPTRGDCTGPYQVSLDKEYTVEELVNAIITNIPGDWGDIRLDNILGETICSYKWGKILSPVAEEYKNRKIIDIKADGGWSKMDYIIKVAEAPAEKEENIHFVHEAAGEINVMTVAGLKELLDYYPDNSIVFISEDHRTVRQVTGFMGAYDKTVGESFLVLTSSKDAKTETYEGYKHVQTADIPETCIVAKDEKPCAMCGTLTKHIDYCGEVRLCSKACQTKYWAEISKGCDNQ